NISIDDREVDIFLAHKVEYLEEVFIKNPPIKKRNNTLVYNASDFKSTKDRSIADAMRKMPGLEINSSGEIKYLGEPINKFYVNDMDMMEGKYSMISNNLNIDDVRSVEILENHQPLKVLDSVVPSDRAAINLKLKNKYTWSGHVTAGAGATPGLWYGKFSPMVFTNNFQSLVSYQTNNTGIDVKNDFTEFSISSFRYIRSTNNRKKWLQLANLSPPPFSIKRWFDNESHALSANALFKGKKDFEFKVNAAYINDYSKKNGSKKTTYKLPEGDLDVDNKTEQSTRDESLDAGFSIERNRKKDFIKEKFNFSKKWDRGTALIFENKTPQNQGLNTSYIDINNNFELITPFFGNQMITFDSQIGYNESPQNLEISPGVFSQILSPNDSLLKVNQNLFHKRFHANHSLDITKKINTFSFSLRSGIDLSTQNMSSQIFINSNKQSNSKFRNDVTWRKLSGYFNLDVNYKSDNLNAILKLPFAIARYEINDKIRSKKETKNPFTLNPSFWTEYKFLDFWSISLNLKYHENFGPLNNIYNGYLLTDYRNLKRQDISLMKTQSKVASFGVKYRDPISNWFANLSLSHSSNECP
ncbi:MAG: Plug domain-containing protein, partial [Lactococcus lactis]|nr:Plug domain-containing protein [Lactococcus lactis]